MTDLAQTPDYDLIVIGAGPVGENVADYAHKRGLTVAVVEAELVGGECSYWACMPSKALLRSGHAVRAATRLAGAAEAVTGQIDAGAVFARRNTFTSNWTDDGQVNWLDSAGIDLLRGRGRLVGPRQVAVDGRTFTAAAVALATGSVPVLPDIPGLAQARPWGTRDATAATSAPARLAVLGGGVAGTELATAYASLGSQVVLVSPTALLGREEPFVGELLAASLVELGVDLRIGESMVDVRRQDDGSVVSTLSDGSTISSDEILVATGRRPNTLDLGLEAVGLSTSGRLEVDESMLVVGSDWLYAVGDVNGRALLTHQGKYQARAAGEAIAARVAGRPVHSETWGVHAATADHLAVPRVVFTDPEIAAVGLTEAQARQQFPNIRAVEYDLGAVAGAALHAGGYQGHAKMVVDQDRDVIVGATFVGQDVAEIVHAATVAIVGELPLHRLWHAVPAYPTISEIWLRLLEAYGRPN